MRVADGVKKRAAWGTVIEALVADSEEGADLRTKLSEALRSVPFRAFFWECPPVSKASQWQRPFEFMVLDAPCLAQAQVDTVAFLEQLEAARGKDVAVAFPNLGGDALLLAPAAAAAERVYAHFASFLRGAPEAQVDETWRKLGEVIRDCLAKNGREVWVNTDGRSVHWMHLRLDTRPKYYRWGPYRTGF